MKKPKKIPKSKLVDQDYFQKLSPEELIWLNEFNSKYYKGFADRNGDLLPPRSEQQKKEDHHRNYASRNDCMALNPSEYKDDLVIEPKDSKNREPERKIEISPVKTFSKEEILELNKKYQKK